MSELNVYTAREVAALLELSVSQVYALVHAGRLRCLRLTTRRQGGLRFTAEQITDFLRASERTPATANSALRSLTR